MAGRGPYHPPKFCGECGNAFPWTEIALSAAKEYADGLDQLSEKEKTALKRAFDDLTRDSARTPAAANICTRILRKISPVAVNVLQKTLESVLTETGKKYLGL